MSRSCGFGIWVGDTDKRDVLARVLQVPDPYDMEAHILTKLEWEKVLYLQATNQTYRLTP